MLLCERRRLDDQAATLACGGNPLVHATSLAGGIGTRALLAAALAFTALSMTPVASVGKALSLDSCAGCLGVHVRLRRPRNPSTGSLCWARDELRTGRGCELVWPGWDRSVGVETRPAGRVLGLMFPRSSGHSVEEDQGGALWVSMAEGVGGCLAGWGRYNDRAMGGEGGSGWSTLTRGPRGWPGSWSGGPSQGWEL